MLVKEAPGVGSSYRWVGILMIDLLRCVLFGSITMNWKRVCQKKVSSAGTSNHIPRILWDIIAWLCPWCLLLAHTSYMWGVITCPCQWYLILAQKSSIVSHKCHYSDVIMTTMASQIISLAVVYSIVYSDADQRKHQSSASLAFVPGIHRSHGEFPVQRTCNAENISIWWRHRGQRFHHIVQ